jgi:tetratricopeptide (TPR) repeat protein
MARLMATQPSMNAPCPCGSGKKYKRCCGAEAANRRKPGQQAIQSRLEELAASGMALYEAGKLEEASKQFDKALAIQPRNSALLGMLGMTALGLNDLEGAERYIRQAINIQPDDSRLHNFMGQVHEAQVDYILAERSFARAITLDSEFFEGWCNLGWVLQKSHQLPEAVSAYQKALELSPIDGQIQLDLVEVYFLLGELEKAEDAARTAQALHNVPEWKAGMWLVLVLRANGKTKEADAIEAQISNAIEKDPEEFLHLLVRFGSINVLVGNLEPAEYWLGRAMVLQPDDPMPYMELAEAKKFSVSDMELVQKMESFSGTRAPYTRRLEFSLGKVWTDLGDYERSFEHYRKGNDLVCETVVFDPKVHIQNVNRRIEQFSKVAMAGLPSGSDSNVPVLIVGTPRSGTTLTEQIISSHSKVAGAGELGFWGRIGGSITEDLQGRYNESVARTMAEGYLNVLRLHSKEAERIIDKMPANFNFVGLIHAVFPNAKIVHCRRHPIDACLSMYFQNFNDDHAYKFSLEGLAVFYEQYLRLMEHWRSVLPVGVMYEVQYEEMVEDTKGESKRLMQFLGLEWEEGQLDFFKKERPVFTCSKWQVRQPIYKTSKERWRRYENHIGPLLPLLKYVNQGA